MSIASSIGTPAAIRPENVREKRASATFCTMSPIFIGTFSLNVSHWICPRSRVLPAAEGVDRAATPSAIIDVPAAGDHVREPDRELRDGGKLAAEVLEDLLEDRHEEGDERDQHDDREAADQRRVDHRRLDLAAQRVVLLELVGHAQQRLVQDAAGLAGGDHRHVELVEDVGVLRERLGERDAGLDVLADGATRPPSACRSRSAPRSRRARAAATCPSETIVASWRVAITRSSRLDLLEAREQVAGAGWRLLLDVEDDQPLAAQLRADGLLVLGLDLPLARGRRPGRAP